MSDLSVGPRPRLSALQAIASIFARPAPEPPVDPVAARQAERDLLHEMMERSPDAFSSELDVMTMLYDHPCRY